MNFFHPHNVMLPRNIDVASGQLVQRVKIGWKLYDEIFRDVKFYLLYVRVPANDVIHQHLEGESVPLKVGLFNQNGFMRKIYIINAAEILVHIRALGCQNRSQYQEQHTHRCPGYRFIAMGLDHLFFRVGYYFEEFETNHFYPFTYCIYLQSDLCILFLSLSIIFIDVFLCLL